MSTSTPNLVTNGAGSSSSSADASERVARQVQDFIHRPGRLLIDGEWVEAGSGKTFETLNPATEESLGWVAHGVAEDIGLAVAAARRCFDDEHSGDGPQRARELPRDQIRGHATRLTLPR